MLRAVRELKVCGGHNGPELLLRADMLGEAKGPKTAGSGLIGLQGG